MTNGTNSNKKVNTNFVKSQMALHGHTYKDLAEMLGKSKASVHNKLAGFRNFTVNELAKMSELYNVPIDYFFSKQG